MAHEEQVRKIVIEEYGDVDTFLDRNLYEGKRVRSKKFLLQKLIEHNDFFIGIFLDDMLAGVVQGFPRDDYLLMSELAVAKNFRRKGYGALLVKAFEKQALKHGFKRIKLGADFSAMTFYKSIGYKPSILIQIHKKDFREESLAKLKILGTKKIDRDFAVEISCDHRFSETLLRKLKKRTLAFSVQYLFTKEL